MPSEADQKIFQAFLVLESALTGRVNNANPIADAINRLIDAHVQRLHDRIVLDKSSDV